jgi:hypothetical protein
MRGVLILAWGSKIENVICLVYYFYIRVIFLLRLSPSSTLFVLFSGVLIHLDQHFIERESYRSGRERTLEISGRGWNSGHVIYPMCCVCIDKQSPGVVQSALSPT